MTSLSSPNSCKTSILTLNDIQLKPLIPSDPTSPERTFKAGELWQNQPCLLLLLRRPGCLLCREEAAELACYREIIQACNVRMVTIAKERGGIEAYNKYWQGEVYLDENMDFFKTIHGGKVNKVGLGAFLGRTIYANYRRAGSKGYTGDNKGEGRILGGLYIVTKDTVVYEYPEKISGDHAPLNVVWNVCKSLAPPGTDFSRLPPPETLGMAYLEERQQRLAQAQQQSAQMLQQITQANLVRSMSTDTEFQKWQQTIQPTDGAQE